MNTLYVSEIFKHFSFYQDHYLSIISDPLQYYTEVSDAYIQVWPFAKQNLYLGDLLQLWFAQKWLIAPSSPSLLQQLTDEPQHKSSSDLYLYQLQGNALTGENYSRAWSLSQHREHAVTIPAVLQHVCVYKALSGVQVPQNPWDQACKSV